MPGEGLSGRIDWWALILKKWVEESKDGRFPKGIDVSGLQEFVQVVCDTLCSVQFGDIRRVMPGAPMFFSRVIRVPCLACLPSIACGTVRGFSFFSNPDAPSVLGDRSSAFMSISIAKTSDVRHSKSKKWVVGSLYRFFNEIRTPESAYSGWARQYVGADSMAFGRELVGRRISRISLRLHEREANPRSVFLLLSLIRYCVLRNGKDCRSLGYLEQAVMGMWRPLMTSVVPLLQWLACSNHDDPYAIDSEGSPDFRWLSVVTVPAIPPLRIPHCPVDAVSVPLSVPKPLRGVPSIGDVVKEGIGVVQDMASWHRSLWPVCPSNLMATVFLFYPRVLESYLEYGLTEAGGKDRVCRFLAYVFVENPALFVLATEFLFLRLLREVDDHRHLLLGLFAARCCYETVVAIKRPLERGAFSGISLVEFFPGLCGKLAASLVRGPSHVSCDPDVSCAVGLVNEVAGNGALNARLWMVCLQLLHFWYEPTLCLLHRSSEDARFFLNWFAFPFEGQVRPIDCARAVHPVVRDILSFEESGAAPTDLSSLYNMLQNE